MLERSLTANLLTLKMSGGEGRNWIKFFRDAGIPEQDAVNYAISFENNRIKHEHLLELSRDILAELGVNKVGDAIAVMKHSREFHHQEQRKIVMTTRSFLEDQHVSSTHPDSSPSEVERKHITQQQTESSGPQWEWSSNHLQRVVSRPDPTPPQPTNEGYHFEEYYNPEPEVALPEDVYATPSNPHPTQSEPAVHEYEQRHHGDVTITQHQYANPVGDPSPVGVTYNDTHQMGVTYDDRRQVEVPVHGLYSDREDPHVMKRIGRTGLKSEDPSAIQRKVFAGNMNLRGKTPSGSTSIDRTTQPSAAEADKTVFTRLGGKKSGSKYYFDKVVATTQSRSTDESVFRRLSTNQDSKGKKTGIQERDRSPIRVSAPVRPTHASSQTLSHTPGHTPGHTTSTTGSNEDLRQRLTQGRRAPGPSKPPGRPQPAAPKTSVMKRLGKREDTAQNIFMRLD